MFYTKDTYKIIHYLEVGRFEIDSLIWKLFCFYSTEISTSVHSCSLPFIIETSHGIIVKIFV